MAFRIRAGPDDTRMAVTAKLLLVAATRPNFMKVAPVMRAIDAWNDDRDGEAGPAVAFDHVLVHTGQHYDRAMSEIFFEDLGMPEPITIWARATARRYARRRR